MLRIVFMGTPEFAVPSLDMLVMEGYEVVAVVTQPDKPKGRGNKMSAPPVKLYALEKDISVLQPLKVKTREFAAEIRELNPDLIVTVAYGKILPKEVLDIPPLGCINVHGSLLPRYRGAAPIQRAVINGEKTTGITTMYMDVGMDTGDMLLKREIDIDDEVTAGELHDRLAQIGAAVLKDTLKSLESGSLKRIRQPENEATYAAMIQKETGLIDWTSSAREVHNLVRGTNPWPGAFTSRNGERLRIWKTAIADEAEVCESPGMVYKIDREGIEVCCGKGRAKLLEVQLDSGKRISAAEYVRGYRINEGEMLG